MLPRIDPTHIKSRFGDVRGQIGLKIGRKYRRERRADRAYDNIELLIGCDQLIQLIAARSGQKLRRNMRKLLMNQVAVFPHEIVLFVPVSARVIKHELHRLLRFRLFRRPDFASASRIFRGFAARRHHKQYGKGPKCRRPPLYFNRHFLHLPYTFLRNCSGVKPQSS